MASDYLRSSGITTLGSRVRRLFERLNGSISELYRNELGFEQRWFALGMLLFDHGPMNSREASERLRQSHVAIGQVVSAMAKAGLVERRQSPQDGRSKMLHLTVRGAEMMARVKAISTQVDRAASALLAEAGMDFLGQLDALDDALDRLSFADRIAATRTEERNGE